MIRHIALAATLALAPIVGSAAEDITELNFGIIATESSTNLKPSWQPLLDDLAKAIGMPVKAFFASDYAGVIEAMRFKKVDVAWYGNKSAMEAVDRADAEVFTKVVNLDGTEGYWSYGIVRKDSPFQNVDEVIAKAGDLIFGQGDPNSTSGTLVPGFYIFAQRGLEAQKIFKRVVSSKHEANIITVATGQADFATVASDSYERAKTNITDKVANTRIVWTSPLIASDPLAWRKSLPEGVKTKVRDFFNGYGQDESSRKTLTALKWSGFRASSNDQLIPIRQLALNKKKAEIQAAKDISDDDRKAKLAEISQKLAELDARLAAAK